MNSILRQSHIRAIDLRDFLRSYDSSNTTAVSVWAKTACAGFEPGSLVFIVEPVTLPFGLISFVRKDEEDNFRVTDFAVIVRIENNKAMAISLTNNTYELRFLESLLEEKAKKAIIDRKRFGFIAAKPAVPLPLTKFQELERLSNGYAKGGSRRTFMNANPKEEPALALLAACGVHLNFTIVNKQPIDIGSICFSLFNNDTKQPDNNRSQLRDNFIPISSDFSEIKVIPASVGEFDAAQGKHIDLLFEKPAGSKAETGQNTTGFNLLQSWGDLGERRGLAGTDSLFEHVAKELPKGERLWRESNSSTEEAQKIEQEELLKNESSSQEGLAMQENLSHDPNEILSNKQDSSADRDNKTETKDPRNVDKQSMMTSSTPDDVYKHLSEAITDLLVPQPQTEIVDKKSLTESTNVGSQNIKVKKEIKWPATRSFDKLPASASPIISQPELPLVTTTASDSEESVPVALNLSESSDLSISTSPKSMEYEVIDQPILTDDESSISLIESENSDIETEDKVAIFSSADMMPSKLDDFQEPKVVMNEMASLTSKLESQVARAAKKLAAKASEIEKRLNTNLDALMHLIHQEDKDGYAELVVRIDLLSKQFESLFDTLKTELAEKAANSRQQIKSKLSDYQAKIHKTENGQRDNLMQEFKQSKAQFGQLVADQESELNKLVDLQTELLNERIALVDQVLEDASANLGVQLDNYFNGFKGRIDDKVLTLLKAFDHHLDILNKDIERLHVEGTEQLSLAKKEFFSKLDRLIQITEIALSRQVRKAQTESFLPRLKERKQIIEAMMHEMSQTFAEHSFSQAKAQSEGAEHSLVLARQQLKELVDERLSKLDVVGRNQQTGLEEIFKSAADPLEQNTAAVVQLLKQAEQEVNECEAVCTKLAQSYNLDGDPKLTSLRQGVYGKVDSLKAELKSNLESVLDNSCQKLEDTTKNYHVRLNTKRAELVQQVRSASDQGLQSIRQAIHDAFHTVQSEREKHME